MGLLINGKWTQDQAGGTDGIGRFQRPARVRRNWITPDGAPGPSGEGGFGAEAGRYHLYVSLACPWAHRALIFRKLKGLEGMISLSVVNWFMGEEGWSFAPGPGVVADPIFGARCMHEVYSAAHPDYTGRVTVPVLFDRQTRRIVNNESSEIIRMFNSAFDGVGALPGDYYPADLRPEIDALNERIYATLNNGVYRSGFASTQAAYEEAVIPLFETLDLLDERLATRRYLCGARLTEADWRLFSTLVRFDAVYHGHFKCNLRRIVDYPNLSGYLRDLFQTPGIAETVDFAHIKGHYYQSHKRLNPSGVVPIGPLMALDAPHGRDAL